MPVAARLVLSLALALIFFFCVFGFLASSEAPVPASTSFRLIYGMIGGLCVLSIVVVWVTPRRKL